MQLIYQILLLYTFSFSDKFLQNHTNATLWVVTCGAFYVLLPQTGYL